MRRVHLAGIFVLFSSSMAGAQAPPVEAFAALPAMQSPSLSPDGKRLAFIAQAASGSFVLVSELDTMKVTSAIDMSAGKPRGVTWTNADTLLVFSGDAINFGPRGRVESTAPYGVDLAGVANVRQLLVEAPRTSIRGGGAAVIGGYRFVQGAQLIGYRRATGEVLFPRFKENANRVLYAVDAKTDRRTEIDEGTQFSRDWVVDESVEPKFRLEYRQESDCLSILARRDGGWERISSETVAIPELNLFGLDAAGELIVGLRSEETGRFGLHVMSAADGSITRVAYAHDELDLGGAYLDPYTNRVIGAQVERESTVWFDAELAAQQKLVDEAFAGERPRLESWSQDRSRFVVSTDRQDRPPAFYLYDAKQSTAKQIASTYAALDRAKLPVRQAYSYAARDGVQIPGYLTRPLDSAGAVPLVVLPHGGPAARDVAGFDWLAHFVASRGYAVLQPNFRGSGGYGKTWEEAGHGAWGIGVMQHDLSDGVAALVAAGIADPERICIVGASYGGYAALAGAVFTPELYRCAAAIAGVADLSDMLQFSATRAGFLSATVSYWQLAMGVDESRASKDRLSAASPIEHVENVRAPVLLVHGLDDSVVPIRQSLSMERALRGAGKAVELVELEGEDHWLSGAQTRLETLKALERFLAQHLGK